MRGRAGILVSVTPDISTSPSPRIILVQSGARLSRAFVCADGASLKVRPTFIMRNIRYLSVCEILKRTLFINLYGGIQLTSTDMETKQIQRF